MRELRAVFVTRSFLLADMLRRLTAIRLAADGVDFRAEIAGDEAAVSEIAQNPPDLIALFADGPSLSALGAGAARLLTVSADLSRLRDSEGGEESELTPDALARRFAPWAR